MELPDNSLMRQGAKILEAITIASQTPSTIARLKYLLYKYKKKPYEIFNKNAKEPQGEAFRYQLTQSYSVIRMKNS